MEDDYFNKAHYTILQNSSLVHPYIEIHKEFLWSKFLGKIEAWIRRQHMESFSDWLRKEYQGDDNINGQMKKQHFDSSIMNSKLLLIEKFWIPSLLNSKRSTIVVLVNFPFEKVWTVQICDF